MLESLKEKDDPKLGVAIERTKRGQAVVWRPDQESLPRVFLPKDPKDLGGVIRLLESKNTFETISFRNDEEYVKERMRMLLEDIKLRRIAEELKPDDLILEGNF